MTSAVLSNIHLSFLSIFSVERVKNLAVVPWFSGFKHSLALLLVIRMNDYGIRLMGKIFAAESNCEISYVHSWIAWYSSAMLNFSEFSSTFRPISGGHSCQIPCRRCI